VEANFTLELSFIGDLGVVDFVEPADKWAGDGVTYPDGG